MTSRRGAVSVGVAASVMAVASVALVLLVDACGEFGVADDGKDSSATPADAAAGDLEAEIGDAAAGVEAAASDAGCAMHSFCADFEEADPFTGWNSHQKGVSGGLAITAGGKPGKALVSTISMSTAQVTDWAYVVQPFPGAMGVHVELEINAPTLALDAAAVITLVQFSGQASTKESGVGVVLRSSGLGFYIASGAGTSTSPNAAIDLPRGKWVHLALDVRFGANGSLALLVDGTSAWNMALVTVPPPTPELRVGVQHYNGGTPDVEVLYDTVRVDLK